MPRFTLRRTGLTLAIGLLLTAPIAAAHAQIFVPRRSAQIKLSGPRFGITYLSSKIVDSLAADSIHVSNLITQFGWQVERQFNAGDGGLLAVSEWVFLVGGLEQGVMLPSLSWIVGLRTKTGSEFGVGPNLGPSGFALAFAGGVTRRAGSLHLPLNLSVVPSKAGTRVSAVAGFIIR